MGEEHDGGGHPAAAAGDEGLCGIDTGALEGCGDLFARAEAAVFVKQFGEEQVARARDMATGQAVHGVFGIACKTPGIARVDDLLLAAVDIGVHLQLGADVRMVGEQHGGVGAVRFGRAAFDWQVPLPPCDEAGIEHGDIAPTRHCEREPCAARTADCAVIVEDDARPCFHAQLCEPLGNLAARRQGGGHRRCRIGQRAKIEEARSGDVAFREFRFRIAFGGREMGGRVENDKVRCVQCVGEVLRRNEHVHWAGLACAERAVNVFRRRGAKRNRGRSPVRHRGGWVSYDPPHPRSAGRSGTRRAPVANPRR